MRSHTYQSEMISAMDDRNARRDPLGNEPFRSAMFGPFEIRLDTGELRKHGVRIRLQGKPFQILSALLAEPGAVVTREHLRTKLWSNDTYVDFESGLNTAVNRLRIALSDSAATPMYVETLSRIGYRFIAPVRFARNVLEMREGLSGANEEPQSSENVKPAVGSNMQRSWILLASLTLVLLTAGIAWVSYKLTRTDTRAFERLTFGSGQITEARFSVDGSKVVYTAAWNSNPPHTFLMDVKTGNTRDLGFPGGTLAGLSPSGEVSIFFHDARQARGRLVVFSLAGGPARPAPERATALDWSRAGTEYVVSQRGAESSIEYPAGRVVYRAEGCITSVRISPDGKRLAFLRHPVLTDDAGEVILLQPGSDARILSSDWNSVRGLAWSPSGREIWFTAARSGVERQLMAVDLRGKTRQIGQEMGGVLLHEVDFSGRLLVTRDTARLKMLYGRLSSHLTRDVSWLDWPFPEGITSDGRRLLFDESGDGGGREYTAYLYDDGPKSYRPIGTGRAVDLSPDGRWALTQSARKPNSLNLVSLERGTVRPVAAHGFLYRWARFLPGDCLEILVGGHYESGEEGVFRQQMPDGAPVRLPFSGELDRPVIDATGELVAGETSDATISLIDLEHGTTRSVAKPEHLIPLAFRNHDEIITWHSESGAILLDVLNVQTGVTRAYQKLDGEGMARSEAVHLMLSKDLDAYAYSRSQVFSTLFLVCGWD